MVDSGGSSWPATELGVKSPSLGHLGLSFVASGDDEMTRRTTPTTGSTVEGTEMCDDGWLPSPWTLPMMTTPPLPRGKGPPSPLAQPSPGLAGRPPGVTTSAGDLRIPCSLSSSPGPVFDMDAARIGSPPCSARARHRNHLSIGRRRCVASSYSPVVHWIVGR